MAEIRDIFSETRDDDPRRGLAAHAQFLGQVWDFINHAFDCISTHALLTTCRRLNWINAVLD